MRSVQLYFLVLYAALYMYNVEAPDVGMEFRFRYVEWILAWIETDLYPKRNWIIDSNGRHVM